MTKRSGLADSPFFTLKTHYVPTPPEASPPIETDSSPLDPVSASANPEQADQVQRTAIRKVKNKTPKQSYNRDVMTSQRHDTVTPAHHEIMVSRSQELISHLRSAVKQIGKEPTTCRLTSEEKKDLKSVEFEYSNRDIQTSANEIMRIATNFIVNDYHENGEESILDKVLKALKE